MRLKEEHVQKFNQILDLLEEAYEVYFENSDGYGKSSDGYAALTFPPYFWREEADTQPGVEIYSYVLPESGRNHYFDTLDEALEQVKEWHRAELAMWTSPCTVCGKVYVECNCEGSFMTGEKILVFDVETTGVDAFNDRIVQLVIGLYSGDSGEIEALHEWIIDPGVEIPVEASDIHGFTTERVRAEGVSSKKALQEALEVFQKHHKALFVAYNAKFDVTFLDAEFKRHGISEKWGNALDSGKVRLYDPYVVDRDQDKYRKGSRKLMNLADHFGIPYDEDALHNARADVDLTFHVFRACYEKYGLFSNGQQALFYRDWAQGFREYLTRKGKTPDDLTEEWPLQKEVV